MQKQNLLKKDLVHGLRLGNFIKKRKKCKASTYWTENPEINWKDRGSADVKQTEFLLIKQRNGIAKYVLGLYGSILKTHE